MNCLRYGQQIQGAACSHCGYAVKEGDTVLSLFALDIDAMNAELKAEFDLRTVLDEAKRQEAVLRAELDAAKQREAVLHSKLDTLRAPATEADQRAAVAERRAAKVKRGVIIGGTCAFIGIIICAFIVGGRSPVTAAPPPQSAPAAEPVPQSASQMTAIEQERREQQGFVWIQGGTFTIGSPASEANRSSNEAQHQVTVSSFYMGKYEVTQQEYAALMGSNPSYFKGAKLPVENVSWYDAVEYCNKRSLKEGLTPAYTRNGDDVKWTPGASGYRLPTEAEWEYACRAGTTTPFSTGSNITTGEANYNGNYPYNGNAKGTYREKTTDVRSFAANKWGLYDMHGNVWEWCWDGYGTYESGAQTDPMGAVSGAYRVQRGGSWSSGAQGLRSANRNSGAPSSRSSYLGFRLVRP
jgi:formylglycine-generating enzyme required for sulfatase activity